MTWKAQTKFPFCAQCLHALACVTSNGKEVVNYFDIREST